MKPIRLNLCVEFLVVAGLVMLFAAATYQRNLVWEDDFTLWTDVVKKSPYKARGYNEIGMYFYELRKPDKAIPYFRKSLYYEPEYAVAHNNLGLCFLATGLIDLAIYEFRRAIKGRPLNGMYHVNLGIAYWKMGLYNLAKKEIQLGKELRGRHKRN